MMDGKKEGEGRSPKAGGLTSDCHSTPRNPKGPPALPQSTRKGRSDSKAPRIGLKNKDTQKYCSKEISLARSQLTCQERRGRRHVVPERETHPLGSEFTRAKPGPYTSPHAWRRQISVSGVISLGANSLPVGECLRKGTSMRTRSAGATLYRAWEGWARGPCPALSRPLPFLQQAEPALPWGGVCPVLTLAAEPEVVRDDGLHRPLVALRFLPLLLHAPGGARISRRPALLPRARLARPVSPASSVSRRPAPR